MTQLRLPVKINNKADIKVRSQTVKDMHVQTVVKWFSPVGSWNVAKYPVAGLFDKLYMYISNYYDDMLREIMV